MSRIQEDIKNAKNWTYCEEDDCFICPNGRRVTFKKYKNKKNPSGYEQSFKIYECEDCTDCPLKAKCTKAKGNRQVHWNPIFEEMKAEEMKAKAKTALECEEKAAIYARRKVEAELVCSVTSRAIGRSADFLCGASTRYMSSLGLWH
ncbi:hypothetical protein GCM10010965_10790 [Caldalkalibacillus thermarum]|uniref:transposase n=1 Tax=Caldalkalibacillus thermarum TaxID=296745 RepID=UPI00166CD725|nr:transposase [Caldalkalibacillus thermarum]GGK19587.1 hypothetical protein GCM10010965_10790 [Caldalkalibacillus thermarum]